MSQEPCKYFSGVCAAEAVKPVLRSTRDSEVCDVSQALLQVSDQPRVKKKERSPRTVDSHWHETDLQTFFWKETRM